MSGILALSTSRPDHAGESLARGMLERLRHRGPDGVDVLAGPGHVLAHFHFWTNPQEVGERQPVRDPDGRFSLAFDGRIDNRADLERLLGAVPPTGAADAGTSSASDARLLLRAWSRWGPDCFGQLLGPFAAVVRDDRTGALVAARDPMGDRTLCYASLPGGIAIASEPHALLAHPCVPDDLDETSLARYFAVEAPFPGATFFRAVREIPAGALLFAAEGRVRIEAFWRPDPPDPLRHRTDGEYAEHLAAVLGDAVEARLRSATRVGISLSGGMDSTSVAALAVERLGRNESRERLASFSWVFDERPECDERRWIQPVVEALGLDATYVLADPHWPLRDHESWPLNPNSPLSNPYRRLKQALYGEAAGRGIRVLLLGVFGDCLWEGRSAWLASRVEEGHLGELVRHVARLLSRPRPRPPWRDPALRALLRRFLPTRRRRSQRTDRPPWLTPQAWRLAEDDGAASLAPDPYSPAARAARVFDGHTRLWASETTFSAHVPVELRDPFRDLRVVRFMLAIPPDQLDRGLTRKFVLRQAMRNRLPDEVVSRTVATPLDSFGREALFTREAGDLARLLERPEALWRGRVEGGWLLDGFPGRFREMPDGRALLLPFFAVAAELWREGLGRGSTDAPSPFQYTWQEQGGTSPLLIPASQGDR